MVAIFVGWLLGSIVPLFVQGRAERYPHRHADTNADRQIAEGNSDAGANRYRKSDTNAKRIGTLFILLPGHGSSPLRQ